MTSSTTRVHFWYEVSFYKTVLQELTFRKPTSVKVIASNISEAIQFAGGQFPYRNLSSVKKLSPVD